MKTLNENDNSPQVPEEIDLIKIISLFWNWCIKYLWHPFLELVRMCLRRWYVFLVAIIVGATIGFFQERTIPTEYLVSMQFKTNCVSPSEYINRLLVLSKQPTSSWKEELKLSDSASINLKAIWPHYICYYSEAKTTYFVDYLDKYLYKEGALFVENLFVIELKVTDTEYLDEYAQAIYNFLLEDPQFTSIYVEDLNKKVQRLAFYQKEISTLEQLRTQAEKTKLSNTMSNSLDKSTSVIEYHQLLSSLNEKVIDLEYVLNQKPRCLHMSFPVKSRKQVATSTNLIATYSLYAFLIAFVLTFIIDYRKELVAFSKKHL